MIISSVSYYLRHPTVPLSQTVGVIALDSIGTGRGPRLLYISQEREMPLTWPVEIGAKQMRRLVRHKSDAEDGWHTLFSLAGVPTVKFIWEGTKDDVNWVCFK